MASCLPQACIPKACTLTLSPIHQYVFVNGMNCALSQVRSLKASANAAADESASAKFRLQTARQAASELREMIVEARAPHVLPGGCCMRCVHANIRVLIASNHCGAQRLHGVQADRMNIV